MAMMLPNTELTKEEYCNLQYGGYFDYGSEAGIIKEGKFAIKFFQEDFGHSEYTEDEIEYVRENKLQKILRIGSMKNFDNGLVPLGTYSYQKKFVAYRMFYLRYPNFGNLCLGERETLQYLKLIKRKLLHFHKLGIVYGDIKDDNIFIDQEHQRIIFGDLDNMQLGTFPIDLMAYYAEDFVRNYGGIDEKLDSYMMNLMTLHQLNYYPGWYDRIVENLNCGFLVCDRLLHPKCRNLVREMGHVDNSYSGEYFVDYL